jgi:Aerobic-type carbon monoxide dehydrogenase, large subunit CoxL/CutL homologs
LRLPAALAVSQRHRPHDAKIPEAELRLITGDIGGSYGLRGSVYPEIILMLWAARRVGRAVKWTQTRNEAHISDDDARDNIVDAALRSTATAGSSR